MADDREVREHKEWLGYVQPVGLLVSPVALAEARAVINRSVVAEQERLRAMVERRALPGSGREAWVLPDFARFTRELLGWEADDLVSGAALPEAPSVNLREEHEVLCPTWALHDAVNAPGTWLLLVLEVEVGRDLDKVGLTPDRAGEGWHASPQARLERLLHATGVPVGLLTNGCELRVVYAPSKESSGHATFAFKDLIEVPGRLLLGALLMLLNAFRVFQAPDRHRLTDILKRSRDFQADVSTRLADQVLRALDELLKGFLLYAEDRGLMPQGEVYTRNYAVAGLFERLRDDAGRYPDTMDQRYGAWARLLTLFRLVHDGGGHGDLRLPPRHGQLFDPDAFPFLEGRPYGSARQVGQPLEAPRVSDGAVWRVLSNLLVLDGERLSYRTLDVEQIGSVYEAIMGFELQRAEGPSVAVRPSHAYVNVLTLVAQKPADRAKWLKEQANCDLAAGPVTLLKNAQTVDDVVVALGRKLSPRTPSAIPAGSLFLQPGEERRRTGSHYTPRSLTHPIVETTLRPVLEALGPEPSPEQILALKVCDPAMGSGAFLVEACRQLGDELVKAWMAHGRMPKVGNPPFAGKNTVINGNRDGFVDWLKTLHDQSHGNACLASGCSPSDAIGLHTTYYGDLGAFMSHIFTRQGISSRFDFRESRVASIYADAPSAYGIARLVGASIGIVIAEEDAHIDILSIQSALEKLRAAPVARIEKSDLKSVTQSRGTPVKRRQA